MGSAEYVGVYLNERMGSWTEHVICLANVATTQPHAAYASFVFGL